MKIFNAIDKVAKPVATFVLKVLGAFGACWGTFSSVDTTRKQFFGYTGSDNLMDNSTYATTALCVSISMATLSSYLIIRQQLAQRTKPPETELEEITVSVPFLGFPQNNKDIFAKPSDSSQEEKNTLPIEVICKKKCDQ